jgi:hypothetical protein
MSWRYGVLSTFDLSKIPTKLCPAIQVHITRSYTQLFKRTLNAIKKQCKFTGTKCAHKMLMKLAPIYEKHEDRVKFPRKSNGPYCGPF